MIESFLYDGEPGEGNVVRLPVDVYDGVHGVTRVLNLVANKGMKLYLTKLLTQDSMFQIPFYCTFIPES